MFAGIEIYNQYVQFKGYKKKKIKDFKWFFTIFHLSTDYLSHLLNEIGYIKHWELLTKLLTKRTKNPQNIGTIYPFLGENNKSHLLVSELIQHYNSSHGFYMLNYWVILINYKHMFEFISATTVHTGFMCKIIELF